MSTFSTSSTNLGQLVWARIQALHFSANRFTANGRSYFVSVWASAADGSVRATIFAERSLGSNVRGNGREYTATENVGQIHINSDGEIVRFDVRPNGL